jgi:lipoate-protein ligase A
MGSIDRKDVNSMVDDSHESIADVSVSSIRSYVSSMNDDQRHNFFALISEGYCEHCGQDEEKHGRCHCWNDE